MDEQTRKLLEECSIGCEMATDSLQQILEYTRDIRLQKLIEDYLDRHKKLGADAAETLQNSGYEAKTPGAVSSTFAWFTTEIKLSFNSDNTQIAKLLMDGCNMGIQTLGERMNTLDQADSHSRGLAEKILKTEQELMKELQASL